MAKSHFYIILFMPHVCLKNGEGHANTKEAKKGVYNDGGEGHTMGVGKGAHKG